MHDNSLAGEEEIKLSAADDEFDQIIRTIKNNRQKKNSVKEAETTRKRI